MDMYVHDLQPRVDELERENSNSRWAPADNSIGLAFEGRYV